MAKKAEAFPREQAPLPSNIRVSSLEKQVAENLGGRPLRLALLTLASLYLSLIALNRFNQPWANALFPGVAVFFAQISALFPTAATYSIEYRAEGWLCREGLFVELDMGRLFPMLADNKENRYHRVMHFYRMNRKVMRSLDDFIVAKHPFFNRELGLDWIGGVRLSSLRIPLPRDRAEVRRHQTLPLGDYAENQRKEWHTTAENLMRERCSEGP